MQFLPPPDSLSCSQLIPHPERMIRSFDSHCSPLLLLMQWNKVEDKYAVGILAFSGVVALWVSTGMVSVINSNLDEGSSIDSSCQRRVLDVMISTCSNALSPCCVFHRRLTGFLCSQVFLS